MCFRLEKMIARRFTFYSLQVVLVFVLISSSFVNLLVIRFSISCRSLVIPLLLCPYVVYSAWNVGYQVHLLSTLETHIHNGFLCTFFSLFWCFKNRGENNVSCITSRRISSNSAFMCFHYHACTFLVYIFALNGNVLLALKSRLTIHISFC